MRNSGDLHDDLSSIHRRATVRLPLPRRGVDHMRPLISVPLPESSSVALNTAKNACFCLFGIAPTSPSSPRKDRMRAL